MPTNKIYNKALYEGLDNNSLKLIKLWESVGNKLKEAALTPDQIQQVFASIEQSSTAGGSNRTLIGKGKDAASAVNQAWEDLKTKVQSSAPIANADAAYDSAVAKIEAGLGGPDNAVNQVIQKYRTFAKAHPVAQGLIYAALIAAAGISGAGLGGAAVLGLLKMTDKLLQGEKFSSAAYSGAKTGATAYAAGQIGQAMQGQPQSGTPQAGQSELVGTQNPVAATDTTSATLSGVTGDQMVSHPAYQAVIQKFGDNPGARKAAMAAAKAAIARGTNESVKLSESQIQQLFINIDDSIILEGFMDTVKQFGKNLTTKITADKLNSAWQKAGSPTDSEVIASLLQDQGVDPTIISNAYTSLSIPAPVGRVDPTLTSPLTPPTAPATSPAIAPTRVGVPQGKQAVDQAISVIKSVRPDRRPQVVQYAKTQFSSINENTKFFSKFLQRNL